MLLYIIYALLLGSAYLNASDNAASAGGKHMLMLSLNPVVVPPWFFQRRQLVQGTWLNCLLGVMFSSLLMLETFSKAIRFLDKGEGN